MAGVLVRANDSIHNWYKHWLHTNAVFTFDSQPLQLDDIPTLAKSNVIICTQGIKAHKAL